MKKLLASLAVLFLFTFVGVLPVFAAIDYVTKWGTNGTGNGQFAFAQWVAVDSLGNVYVVDNNNHRVQKFNSSGTYITKWGSGGSGNSQFSFPTGIAIDSSNNVYVSDNANHRIQKFDSSGTYITQWGSNGTGDGQFAFVSGIAVDSSGNVYVADVDNDRIQKFNSSGTYITKWGSTGTGNSQFNEPRGIAVDTSGNVYVADSNNKRVQKFTSTGTYVSQWGTSGTGNGQFNLSMGVAVDSSNNVYVSDFTNNQVQKFDSSGTYLTKFGSSGSANGQFNGVIGVAVSASNEIYVADNSNHRVQKFLFTADTTPQSSTSTVSNQNIFRHPSTTDTQTCGDSSPVGKPDLFEVNAANNFATLSFKTVEQGVTGYAFSYGYDQKAENFSDKIDYNGPKWLLDHTVWHLSPNTEYYFKVRAVNGCGVGEWSTVMKAKTGGKLSAITQYFPNAQGKTVAGASTTAVLGATTITECEYTIKGGDSLWTIAKAKWGSGSKYSEILNLNSGITQESILKVGSQLKLCN